MMLPAITFYNRKTHRWRRFIIGAFFAASMARIANPAIPRVYLISDFGLRIAPPTLGKVGKGAQVS